MFNQSKFVECYLASDMEKEYALHRQKLISFAHLLGSDYTEGIPGIGPVTALEILTEFSSLEEFRDWWTKVQTG
ncbi:DNA excision repair protein, partial [Aspergillus sclerotialis]